jgi:hypothetical protein
MCMRISEAARDVSTGDWPVGVMQCGFSGSSDKAPAVVAATQCSVCDHRRKLGDGEVVESTDSRLQ